MKGKERGNERSLQFDQVDQYDTAIVLAAPCATIDNLSQSIYTLGYRNSLYIVANRLSNLLLSILSKVQSFAFTTSNSVRAVKK